MKRDTFGAAKIFAAGLLGVTGMWIGAVSNVFASCPQTIPNPQACVPTPVQCSDFNGNETGCLDPNNKAIFNQNGYFGCQSKNGNYQCVQGLTGDTAVCYYDETCSYNPMDKTCKNNRNGNAHDKVQNVVHGC